MNVLDLDHVEAQFGLLIREKENHDNYALLRFEDLEKMIEYYNSFKKEFYQKIKSNSNKKMEKSKWFLIIVHYVIWWIFWNGTN